MSENSHLDIQSKIRKLFEQAKDLAGSQKIVKNAVKLYNECVDKSAWLSEFLKVLKYCLVYRDKTAANRMLWFVAKFSASLFSQKSSSSGDEDNDSLSGDDEEPFVSGLFRFLFEVHSAAHTDARLRSVTLINYVLSSLPEKSWLPGTIWDGLSKTIKMRLKDRNVNIRVAAVLVAHKLQDATTPSCEIRKLLSFHMKDPAPAVRRAALSSIGITKVTIDDVLARTLDVNENVRRNAFAALAKIPYSRLSITQRIVVLERGLKDRAERVRDCVEKVILRKWLPKVENDEILRLLPLLEALDVVNCADVALLALESIAKLEPLDDLIKVLPFDEAVHIVPLEKLTPEVALLWRFLVHQAHQNSLVDTVDYLLPNVSTFVKLISTWYPLSPSAPPLSTDEEQWIEVKKKRVVVHLLQIAPCFDYSDEVGRTNLRHMCIQMLKNPRIGCQLVPDLLDVLLITGSSGDFMRSVFEVISDIRKPLDQAVVENIDDNDEILIHKRRLNQLRIEENAAIKNKNFTKMAEIANNVEELLEKIETLTVQPGLELSELHEECNDPETVCKCLKILIHSISVSKVKKLSQELLLQIDFIYHSLASSDLLTHALSIEALAKYCILDSTIAQNHLLRFVLLLSENGENDINLPAIKAVFDIIQIHGTHCVQTYPDESDKESTLLHDSMMNSDEFSSQQSEGKPKSPIAKCFTVLGELLKISENEELKLTVFEGFCKLLAIGVVRSPSLLKAVIIKGFTPIRGSKSEDRIRQIFAVFFSIFARDTLGSQEMIEAAFIPVLRKLKQAQCGTAEADICVRDVAYFLIDHTRPEINVRTSSTNHIHNNLGLSICHEILRDFSNLPETEPDQIYLRSLVRLNLLLDSCYIQQLNTLLTKIKRETKEPAALRCIKQLQDKLLKFPDSSAVKNLDNTNRRYIQNDTKLKEPLEDDYGICNSILSSPSEQVPDPILIIPESPETSSD